MRDYRIWTWDGERPIGEFPELYGAINHCHYDREPWRVELRRPLDITLARAPTADERVSYSAVLVPLGDHVRFATKADQEAFGRHAFFGD